MKFYFLMTISGIICSKLTIDLASPWPLRVSQHNNIGGHSLKYFFKKVVLYLVTAKQIKNK